MKITKMKENIVADKSVEFSLRLIKLYKILTEQKKEYILPKQMLRSGTALYIRRLQRTDKITCKNS